VLGIRVAFTALIAVLLLQPTRAQLDFPDGGSSSGGAGKVYELGDVQARYQTEGLSVLGEDMFGETVDIDTGSLSIAQVDVLLPGNSSLDVAVKRSGDRRGQTYAASLPGFGNWSLDIPMISQEFLYQNGIPLNRCSGIPGGQLETPISDPLIPRSWLIPGGSVDLEGGGTVWVKLEEFYNGLQMSTDRGGGALLAAFSNSEFASTGARFVTKDNWIVHCIPDIGGGQGEGFLATAPDGTKYHFRKRVVYAGAGVRHVLYTDGQTEAVTFIQREALLVTHVEDVHGNRVDYTYTDDKLTRISANDGRVITLTWSGDKVTSVQANGRTWTYRYDDGHTLNRVTLPDGTYWTFSGQGWSDASADSDCGGGASGPFVVKHPSGATATFNYDSIFNGRFNLTFPYPDRETMLRSTPDCWPEAGFFSGAVVRKEVVAANSPSQVWSWEYQQDAGRWGYPGHEVLQLVTQLPFPYATSPMKTRTVTRPDGSRVVTHINRSFDKSEGQIEKVERFSASGTLLQSEAYVYDWGHIVGAGLLPGRVLAEAAVRARYLVSKTAKFGSDTYTTNNAYQKDQLNPDYAFGSPRSTTETSTVGTAVRTRTFVYANNRSKWILGLPASVTQNGVLVDSLTYNANGQVTQKSMFGALSQTFGYNADGTTAWVKDALNRQSSLSDYKRGTPQQITRPDNRTVYRTVDDNGWLTSQTDARGFRVTLSHDNMGRITAVDLPPSWADIIVSYSGLGSGAMTQTATKGTLRTTTTFDSFIRPTLIKTESLTTGEAIFSRKTYDAMGRASFVSLPSASSSAPAGVTTTYDALGRVTQTRETVSPFATTMTAYGPGNTVSVTNALGQVTRTTRVGFASPEDGYVTRIDEPLGMTTTMTYDALGNMTSATQGGLTQTWAYDSQYRVCAHYAAESGVTRYAYDAAGQMTGYIEGQSQLACGALPSGAIWLTYDALGRNTLVDYPDATPDITRTFDPNGNTLSVVRGGTSWGYIYNDLDKLTYEGLNIDGRSYAYSYLYDAQGSLSGASMPFWGFMAFSPDAFGRPTAVSIPGGLNPAYNIRYFPDGTVSSLNLGNGVNYLARQNEKLQITNAQSIGGPASALAISYSYDPLGRVSQITNLAIPSESRAFSYDALGRLATASGPWGAGSFSYDNRGNLERQVQGPRTIELSFDTTRNRVASWRDTSTEGSWQTVAHDAAGRITTRGSLGLTYDAAGMPIGMSGQAVATYTYDGNQKRVKSVVNGLTTYSVYSSLTGQISMIDEVGTADRFSTVNLGPVSIRRYADGNLEYIWHDHLGSPVSGSGPTGSVLWRESYYPFGQKWQATLNRDKPSFTGHVEDSATGLTYMQARYYDPVLGRFLSPDPVGFAQGGVRYFNRYAYTANDPVNATDPDGRYTCANAGCTKAFVDPYVAEAGSPPIDPSLQGADDFKPVRITFENDDPNGASPDQPITTETAEMIEAAVAASGVTSVNINSTTGGSHSTSSRHYQGRAADINRVDGKPVSDSSNASAVAAVQSAFAGQENIRENFGPSGSQKTSATGTDPVPRPEQDRTHRDHIHVSGQR
jgi:RHS repeat-associated protein